jgi:hypothetical protein
MNSQLIRVSRLSKNVFPSRRDSGICLYLEIPEESQLTAARSSDALNPTAIAAPSVTRHAVSSEIMEGEEQFKNQELIPVACFE